MRVTVPPWPGHAPGPTHSTQGSGCPPPQPPATTQLGVTPPQASSLELGLHGVPPWMSPALSHLA